MSGLLRAHREAHPDLEVQDAVKFLYQRHMGPGHLLPAESSAFARLQEEWDKTPADPDIPLYDPVGNGLCRLHLSACKAICLSSKTVCRLFWLTARDVVPDPDGLSESLDLVYALPFAREEVDAYLKQYRAWGCPMVSHSPRYRDRYAPAYRIVSQTYADLLPLLAAIDRGQREHPHLRVAMDGPCASGKSTLAAALAGIYDAPVVHMDDFFLRPPQRTPERLAQPGGNVDYERFYQEVLAPLTRGEAARYRPWQCRTQQLGPEVTVDNGPLTLVEGSYSLRPDLREGYHIKVWVEAPWPVRRQRISDRDGADCLKRFEQLWVPLEDRYFDAFRVKECCDVCLSM